MNNRTGMKAIFLSWLAIVLMLVSIDSHRYDDGINLKLAHYFAKVLSIAPGASDSEPSFRSPSTLDLNEEKAILLVGSLSVVLGLISIALGFQSIKKKEHPTVSFGAIGFGLSPIILLNIIAAIACFALVGPAAVWYKKQLIRRKSKDEHMLAAELGVK